MKEVHESASAVMRAALAALREERWADVIPYVRPDAMKTFRDAQARWMAAMEERPPRSPGELQAEQPWITREIAIAYAEQERKHVAGSLPVMREQWGVTSLGELQGLPPAEFFVRHLATSSPSAKIRAALLTSHRPPEDLASALRAAASEYRRGWTVLGEVVEGDDKAHVVYRELVGTHLENDVRVATLDRAEGQWWLRIAPPLLDQQGWSFAWASLGKSPSPDA